MSKTWPTPADPCYDCGSNLPGRHTPLCACADVDDARDLEQVPGTQWRSRAQRRRGRAANDVVGKMARGYHLTQRRSDQHYLLDSPDGMEFCTIPTPTIEALLNEGTIEEDVARSTNGTLMFRLTVL